MWLNDARVSDSAILGYRESLRGSSPNHIVIDGLFNETKLDEVLKVLRQPQRWQVQKHLYSALYVDDVDWQKSNDDQHFVRRDVWLRESTNTHSVRSSNVNSKSAIMSDHFSPKVALDFLSFLRGDEFLNFLSRIFKVVLTDKNVADSKINVNYFRLGAADFVRQHADDSPGRQVCMLLYLNKDWGANAGGDLIFMGRGNKNIRISPLYNRCVLFNPSSPGSEHWVERVNSEFADDYRFNVTSWYWSE